MDATKLEFNDSSFDLIFDKGTLDSILVHNSHFSTMFSVSSLLNKLNHQCGENAEEQCDQTLRGISRCLRPNCAFVCVSFGSPENRLNYLENAAYGWTVAAPVLLPKPQLIKVESKDDDDSQHFVYVCTKQAKE
jgi:ubiquinone/menaquinone biosynthesis C-methylase UbiE